MMIAIICLYAVILVLESVWCVSPPLLMSHHNNLCSIYISQMHYSMASGKFSYKTVKIYHTTNHTNKMHLS